MQTEITVTIPMKLYEAMKARYDVLAEDPQLHKHTYIDNFYLAYGKLGTQLITRDEIVSKQESELQSLRLRVQRLEEETNQPSETKSETEQGIKCGTTI